MKYSRSDFVTGLECILTDPSMRVCTVFCNPKNPKTERIRMTRRGKNELIITMGKPNYREREFMKSCFKARTHPRKVWFQFFTKKKTRR